MIAALSKQVVPATNESALVLVVDEIESVILPVLAHRAHELLECHLTLCLSDDIADDGLARAELKIPNIAKGH